MGDGFSVNLEEFEQLPQKQKLSAIYHNTLTTRQEINDMRDKFDKHQRNDKFNFRIIRWMIGLLALTFGLTKYFGVF